MNKLLVICGPTAVGKTSLGMKLAKKLNAEIVSADSRQVYKCMDIGTGKDLPVNSSLQFPISNLRKQDIGCYEIEGIRLWGYDLVSPKKEFSVADYLKKAEVIVKEIWKENKLPILIGGTGFYIKAVIDGIPTAGIPKNRRLRKNLEKLTADELFEKLAQMDAIKAGSMNASDSKNPRRLIRAIEVAQWRVERAGLEENEKKGLSEDIEDLLMLGLKTSRDNMKIRIKKRVEKRAKSGLTKEIKCLLDKGVSWNNQAMQALGYSEWECYFKKKCSRKEVIDNWMKDESSYAKRQMTWFRRDDRIQWFAINSKEYPDNIEKNIARWYKKTYDKKN